MRLCPVLIPLILVALAVAGGARAARVEVEIEGLEGPAAKNVRLSASIAAAADEELAPRRIQRLHARAPGEIELALQPFGYYRSSTRATLEEVAPERWVARYVIDPGPAIKIDNVDLELAGEGREDPKLQAAFAAFPLAAGDVLEHAAYERAKSDILFAAADNGYFDAAFDSAAIRVDRAAYFADIVLHFDSGPRYRFGPVSLEQDILDPRVLEGYVTFAEGEPYEVEKLLKLQAGLGASPYFARVEAKPRPDLATDLEVPIEVELEPRRTQHYDVGLGYGTDTGIRGTFDVELRRLNRRGHRAEGSVKLSRIERSAAARYVMPSFYPSTAVYSLFAGFAQLRPETSKSDQWVIGGNVTQERWGWQETVTLSYEFEDFEVGSDTGTSRLLLPAIGWSRTRADDRIFTRRGYRLRFDVTGAHEKVLSTSTLLQVRADGKVIRPLGDRMRLLLRAGGGRTWTDEFHELPATLRFFAGGDQSVRGYRYKALGPLDGEGSVIGGEILIETSAEIEVRVIGPWGVGFFFDAGNALSPSSPFFLEKGTGAGIRWRSPIGLVRVDGAYAVGTDNMVRLHVAIGPDL